MSYRVTRKIIAVLIMGLGLGAWIHLDDLYWIRQGREAFLARQTHHFDRIMVMPHLSIGVMIVAIIITALFVGLYELLVAVISKVSPNDRKSHYEDQKL
jgi:hypothetical protein